MLISRYTIESATESTRSFTSHANLNAEAAHGGRQQHEVNRNAEDYDKLHGGAVEEPVGDGGERPAIFMS